MRAVHTRRWLGLALVATLVAAYLAPPPASEPLQLSERVRQPPPRSTELSTRATSPAAVQVLEIRPRGQDGGDDGQGWFATSAEVPKPEKKAGKVAKDAAPVVAAAPQAPPLPFKVLGRYWEDSKEVVFLQYNDQNLVVRVGDTIGQDYKVESLEGNTMTLRYTPLNQTQTLNVGAAK